MFVINLSKKVSVERRGSESESERKELKGLK